MRVPAIAVAAVITAAPAPGPPRPVIPPVGMPMVVPGAPARTDCPETAASLARREGGRLAPERLAELPGADHYAAVYRRIDGCEAPLVVSFDVGGPSPARMLAAR